MSPELEKDLYDKFPELYEQHNLSMMETCMCWGFECPDEWFFTIFELSQKITDYMKENDFRVQAAQVKEKYGDLRFDVDMFGATPEQMDKVDEFITSAEHRIATMGL